MNATKMAHALNHIDDELVAAADGYAPRTKRPAPAAWAAAACLALALVGVVATQGNWFGAKSESVTLANGELLVFEPANMMLDALDLNIETRELTADEVRALFAALPVSDIRACFTPSTTACVGLQGSFAGVKFVAAAPGAVLIDTVVEGHAGYFLTHPNSHGERTAIYYATVKCPTCTIYLENAGTEADREEVRAALVRAVDALSGANINLGDIAR